MSDLFNCEIADRLLEVAQLLLEQGANPFRIRAYRHAAETLRALPTPVAHIFRDKGLDGLRELPGVGESIARSIRDMLLTGRLPMLDRLRGEADPVTLLASVPGIGKVLAGRLHRDLDIHTLEDLETAAHDRRLSQLGGIGEKKLAGIIATLRSRLARLRGPLRASVVLPQANLPSVAELLDVDREYRRKAEAGELRLLAPRRFNPKRQAWLPVLHTERGTRHYTALFSNTAHAHRLGMTRDWVILYYDDGGGEQQCTVLTARRDPLKGRRIVRGREADCAAYYAAKDAGQEAVSTQRSAPC
jgi:DNA polymerase (family 10)